MITPGFVSRADTMLRQFILETLIACISAYSNVFRYAFRCARSSKVFQVVHATGCQSTWTMSC